MPAGYEFFDHTADVGAVVRGATLRRLFENAARALFDLTADRRTVRPRRSVRVAVTGSGREDLLVRWLSELIYLRDVKGWLFASCEVDRVDRRRLTVAGRARGEPFDRARHATRHEVKAVTYHQLRLARGKGGWRARIIFDI